MEGGFGGIKVNIKGFGRSKREINYLERYRGSWGYLIVRT